MFNRATLCAFLSATALSVTAAQAADDVTTFSLENGLNVVVIEDHRAAVVTQMVWYRVGAADEPPGHSGIAHFLEHLMFQGTANLEPGEFSATVEANGGDDNAFTSWDYTAYFQRIAADRLELMMQMEADRMQNLQLLDQDVLTERNVILEERKTRTDSSPGALMTEQTRAAQYLNHPYGVPIIGWNHEIEALDRQDALDFYRRYYAPNNAILVVAGDVTPEEVRVLAEKHYGSLKPSETLTPRARPSEPPQLSERRLVYADSRVSEPYVLRSYLAPERDPGDQAKAAALTILAELLGGSGTTSLFAQALQFGPDPVAVYSSAFYNGTTVDDTTFGVVVVPSPGKSLAEAEAAMDAVIARFIETGPDADDFARIKTQIAAAQIYARDNVDGLARRYGEGLSIGLTIDDIQLWPAVLDAVTPEAVVSVAQEVLDKRRAVTGWLLPEEGTN